MKVTLETKILREAVNTAALSAAKRPTLPITNDIFFDVQSKEMTLKATDLQDGVIVTIPCEATDPFSLCIPYKTIQQYVSTGDGMLTIKTESHRVCSLERTDIGEMSLRALADAKEFPPIPYDPKIVWHKLNGKEFCRILGILLNGVATDESRPVLCAVFMKDGHMASADGFRLYTYDDPNLSFGLGDKEVLLNRITALKVIKLFGKAKELEVGFSSFVENPQSKPERIYFKSSKTILVGQLVLGTFPRYEKLVPVEYQVRVYFSVPMMLQRIQVINPQAVESGILRVQFMETVKHEQICMLTTGQREETSYELSLPVKVESPLFGKIAVNMKYIGAAIKYFSECYMELTSPSSPMKFTGDINGLTVTVMPMFVQW